MSFSIHPILPCLTYHWFHSWSCQLNHLSYFSWVLRTQLWCDGCINTFQLLMMCISACKDKSFTQTVNVLCSYGCHDATQITGRVLTLTSPGDRKMSPTHPSEKNAWTIRRDTGIDTGVRTSLWLCCDTDDHPLRNDGLRWRAIPVWLLCMNASAPSCQNFYH